MNTVFAYALVAGGGALGAMCRFALSGHWLAHTTLLGVPLGILAVNWLGSALMGVLIGTIAHVGTQHNHALHLLIATGFLGGFTTFSAFALEVVALLQKDTTAHALAYALLSVVGSVLFLFATLTLTKAALHG